MPDWIGNVLFVEWIEQERTKDDTHSQPVVKSRTTRERRIK